MGNYDSSLAKLVNVCPHLVGDGGVMMYFFKNKLCIFKGFKCREATSGVVTAAFFSWNSCQHHNLSYDLETTNGLVFSSLF